MRNKELIFRLLERLEGIKVNLKRIVQTNQPISEYNRELEKMEDILDQIKSMVEQEPGY